jgi:hypothetical protein
MKYEYIRTTVNDAFDSGKEIKPPSGEGWELFNTVTVGSSHSYLVFIWRREAKPNNLPIT